MFPYERAGTKLATGVGTAGSVSPRAVRRSATRTVITPRLAASRARHVSWSSRSIAPPRAPGLRAPRCRVERRRGSADREQGRPAGQLPRQQGRAAGLRLRPAESGRRGRRAIDVDEASRTAGPEVVQVVDVAQFTGSAVREPDEAGGRRGGGSHRQSPRSWASIATGPESPTSCASAAAITIAS